MATRPQKPKKPAPDAGIDAGAPVLPGTPLRFAFHFLSFYWLPLGLMSLMEAGQAVSGILLPDAIRRLIDGVQHMPQGADVFTRLHGAIYYFVGLNVALLVFSRISGSILVMVGPLLRARIRETLFAYLQHHSQRYFMGNFAGSLANRISEVTTGVAHGLWTVMFEFWALVLTFGVSLYLLWHTSALLGNVLAVWVLVYVVVSFILASKARRLAKDAAAARSLVSGKVVDAVTNMMNIKIFARRLYERDYLREFLDLEVAKSRRIYWFLEIIRWFQFVSALILMVALLYAALYMVKHARLSVGAFAMVFTLAMVIVNEARGLSRWFLDFFEAAGNVSDGVSVIVRSHEVVDRPKAPALEVKHGAITFDHVTFAHEGHARVFTDLNLAIQPGQKVGLVGPSGAGKSTFANLLLRLYDLQGGRIVIDGQNIADVRQDSLRTSVAVIPQDPMLFHRSLLENIRYGRLDATDEEVYAAAKMAYCDEFISNIPQGYGALVGERGIKLSGGQRQRIAIARAFLKNAPILVLDEATSSLDSASEGLVQKSLYALMKNRTVIVIAHRLSTIAHLDRILVFDNGQVVEDGPHAALVQKPGGLYSRLWGLQAGGFLGDGA